MGALTVFNRYDAAADDVRYYATIIHGATLQVDKAAAISTSGLKDADSMWCSIPYSNDGEYITIDGKKHLSPREWALQVGDDMETTLTIAEGKDILLDGEWKGANVVNDRDYPRTGFLSFLRGTHDGVYLINSVARYDLIPHFELGGA